MKKRRCRMTAGERDLHEQAIRVRKMTDKQLAAAGIPAGLVRMSCGLESKQDLIGDIAQALDQVK